MLTLKLTIAGLFLMVEDGDLVHVIAPFANSHGHGEGHPPHDLSLVYPAASGRAPDTLLDFSLDFRQLPTKDRQTLTIPSTVVELAELTGRDIRLARSIVATPDDRKAGHFILKRGAMTVLNNECCRLPMAPNDNVMVAGQLMWTIKLNTSSLAELIAKSREDGAEKPIKVPPPTRGEVRIGVVHTISRSMPRTLEELEADRAVNFDHFSSMFQFWPRETPVSPMRCGPSSGLRGSSQCTGTKVKAAK